MTSHVNRPILITGSHRSGSSWAGKMIALSPSVAYINEPFNLYHTPRNCRAKFDYWFTYICEKNELLFLKDIADCIQFKYPLMTAFKSITSTKDAAKLIRDSMLFTQHRVLDKRPLLKDPIAIFSTNWLVKTFSMDAVILIRHPAAFAGSLKSSRWTHPFNNFLKQPLLMDDHLYTFRHEIEEFSKYEKSPIDQAILLWNLIHHMILKYRNSNPEWIFIRHEDLSEDPLNEFRNLYGRLELDYSLDVEKKIKSFSFSDHASGIKRDSKSNRWGWKKRLTLDEINRIKIKTHEISSKFYTDADWGE